MRHTLQSTLANGHLARIVKVDFSAGFNWVNHQRILYKLCSVGIGGSVLSILTQFLSNRPQHVMMDGCQVNWLMQCEERRMQGSVLGLDSSCSVRIFFPSRKYSLSIMPVTPL